MGRNVQLCYGRFSLRLVDVTDSMFSVRAIDNLCRNKVDDDMIRNVEFVAELVKIRDNMLLMSNDAFSLTNVKRYYFFSMYFMI